MLHEDEGLVQTDGMSNMSSRNGKGMWFGEKLLIFSLPEKKTYVFALHPGCVREGCETVQPVCHPIISYGQNIKDLF